MAQPKHAKKRAKKRANRLQKRERPKTASPFPSEN